MLRWQAKLARRGRTIWRTALVGASWPGWRSEIGLPGQLCPTGSLDYLACCARTGLLRLDLLGRRLVKPPPLPLSASALVLI